MRIQFVSDIHLEFHKDGGNTFIQDLITPADVLVLAGDICNHISLESVMGQLCVAYPEVIFVPGNHDYYSSMLKGDNIASIRGVCAKLLEKFLNFHILDNNIVILNGQKFVGTTLWFKFDPYMHLLTNAITDFRLIPDLRNLVSIENDNAVRFLGKELTKGSIMITHHAPSRKSIHERYCGNPLNPFFYCELDRLIMDREPAYVIHGHTHDSFDYAIESSRVLCNPFGYVRYEENPKFDIHKVIEIP